MALPDLGVQAILTKNLGLQANTLYMLEFLYITMQQFLFIGSKPDGYGSFFFFRSSRLRGRLGDGVVVVG